jgi:hypothetical protein
MEVSRDQIAQWFSDTVGQDEAAVRSATANLEAVESSPGFAMCVLSLSAGLLLLYIFVFSHFSFPQMFS